MWIDPSRKRFYKSNRTDAPLTSAFITFYFCFSSLRGQDLRTCVTGWSINLFAVTFQPQAGGKEGGEATIIDISRLITNVSMPSEIVQNRTKSSFFPRICSNSSVSWLVQSADAIFLAKAVEINVDAVISLLRQNCTQDSTPRCVLRPSLRSLSLSPFLFLSPSNPIKLEILLISQWRFR